MVDVQILELHGSAGYLKGQRIFLLAPIGWMNESDPLPATTHLVAHCTREIESAVRDVLESICSHRRRNAREW